MHAVGIWIFGAITASMAAGSAIARWYRPHLKWRYGHSDDIDERLFLLFTTTSINSRVQAGLDVARFGFGIGGTYAISDDNGILIDVGPLDLDHAPQPATVAASLRNDGWIYALCVTRNKINGRPAVIGRGGGHGNTIPLAVGVYQFAAAVTTQSGVKRVARRFQVGADHLCWLQETGARPQPAGGSPGHS